jgi:hypothetical protein
MYLCKVTLHIYTYIYPYYNIYSTLLKVANVNYVIVNCNNESMSPNEELPFLRYNNQIYQLNELNNKLLPNMGHDVDDGLNKEELAETIIMKGLIEEKLHRSYIASFWGDSDNFNSFTRYIYIDTLPFPINYIFPLLKRNNHTNTLKNNYNYNFIINNNNNNNGENNNNNSKNDKNDKIYEEFKISLQALSDKLGNDDYFFHKETPHSIDCLIYSYLIMFITVPLKNNQLQKIVKSFPNLCQLVERINTNYFITQHIPVHISLSSVIADSSINSTTTTTTTTNSSSSTTTTQQQQQQQQQPKSLKKLQSQKRSQYFVIGSIFLFLSYFFIKVRSVNSNDDDEDEEEDDD